MSNLIKIVLVVAVAYGAYAYLQRGGEFIVPVPEVKVVDKEVLR